jgi:hypothetical protein
VRSFRSPSRALALGAVLAAAAATAALPGPSLAAASAPVWAPRVIVDDDPAHGSGEPSITVAGDGTIYLAAPAGLASTRAVPTPVGNGGALMWRSDDGGATWTFLPNTVFGGGDADIVAGDGDDLIASGLALACVSVARSPDRGATWVNNPVGCSNTPVDDRQWNDRFGDAVYTSFGQIPTDIYINRSLISSPAVVPGPNVRVSNDIDYQWVGVLSVDQREGVAWQAWNTTGSPNDCDDGGCSAPASSVTPDVIKVAKITDSDFTLGPAATPEVIEVASREFDTFDAFVGVDVSPEGHVYVVWNERHPEVQQTWSMLSVSRDDGATWTEPKRVNTIATTAFPWVTAGDDGRVAVTYYGTAATGPSPETVDGQWRVYSAYSADGGATFTETVATPDPLHAGAVCTSGTGCAGGTRDLIDFFETDVLPDGCLAITYTDNSRDEVVGGVRAVDEPEFIAFVRQAGGPGLKAGSTCGAAAPAPDPEPTAGTPTLSPTPPPVARPVPPAAPLPSTGPSTGLGVLALACAAGAVATRRTGRA